MMYTHGFKLNAGGFILLLIFLFRDGTLEISAHQATMTLASNTYLDESAGGSPVSRTNSTTNVMSDVSRHEIVTTETISDRPTKDVRGDQTLPATISSSGVKGRAKVIRFSTRKNVVTAESDAVFECIVKENPAPDVRIRSLWTNDTYTPNDVSPYQENCTNNTFILSNVTCNEFGDYTCEDDNGRQNSNYRVKLEVLCKPEVLEVVKRNQNQEKMYLELRVTAYPQVDNVMFHMNDQQLDSVIDEPAMREHELHESGINQQSLHTLSLIQVYLDLSSLGKGNALFLRIHNSQGYTDFKIPIDDYTVSQDSNSTFTAIVAGSVLLAVIIIIIIGVILAFRFRNKKRYATASPSHSQNNQRHPETSQDDGRMISEQGLVYVTVDHAKTDGKKTSGSPDGKTKSTRDPVEYVSIHDSITPEDDGRAISDQGLVYVTVEHAQGGKKTAGSPQGKVKPANDAVEYVSVAGIKTPEDDGRTVTDQGLVYVTVEHAQGGGKKPAGSPAASRKPVTESTNYVSVDFKKTGEVTLK